MDWSDWIQDVGKTVITSATEAQYKQPFEIQKMQLAAMGPFGMPYLEGVATPAQQGAPVPSSVAGIPTAWLLIGLVALVVMAD